MGHPDYFHLRVTGWRGVGLSWAALGAVFPHMRNAASEALA
ncbi:hypothetical protein EDF56_106354 [Novosphingobium sp. PhB165]|nr:hypothetical protein EDF56_106354 [Novosphingobium sp. PhB165]